LAPDEVVKSGNVEVVGGKLKLSSLTSLGNFIVTQLSVKGVIPKLNLKLDEEEEEDDATASDFEAASIDAASIDAASVDEASSEELAVPLSPSNPPSVTSSLTSNGSQPLLQQPSFVGNNESTILVNDITTTSDPEVTLNASVDPPAPPQIESSRIKILEDRNDRLEVQLSEMRKEMLNMQGVMQEMLKIMRSQSK